MVNYNYDLNGNRANKTLQNGTATAYSYDVDNRLVSLNNQKAGVSFARYEYGYDNVDRRTFVKRDSAKGDVYGYDATSQITSVQYEADNPDSMPSAPVRTTGYNWDAVGNRTTVTNTGVPTNYTTNQLNQYTAVAGRPLTYNDNGALKTMDGWTFTYDAQDRLVKAEKRSTLITFDYDPLNRCVKRVINNGAGYLFYYDNWSLIEEYNTGNGLMNTYIHGSQIDEVLVKKPAGTGKLVYYQYDGLGSVTQLTDYLGRVVEKYSYDIFGKPAIRNGSGTLITNNVSGYGNRFMFTGREYMKELKLYDYRNRMFSDSLGKFLQTDLLQFKARDVNLYRYLGNNPLNSIDPLGLQTQSVPYIKISLGNNYSASASFWTDAGIPDICNCAQLDGVTGDFNISGTVSIDAKILSAGVGGNFSINASTGAKVPKCKCIRLQVFVVITVGPKNSVFPQHFQPVLIDCP